MPALASHAASSASTGDSARQLEADVRRALLSEEGLDIASLVVRRLPNGVCLEGVIRVNGDDVDVCKPCGNWSVSATFEITSSCAGTVPSQAVLRWKNLFSRNGLGCSGIRQHPEF